MRSKGQFYEGSRWQGLNQEPGLLFHKVCQAVNVTRISERDLGYTRKRSSSGPTGEGERQGGGYSEASHVTSEPFAQFLGLS